MKSLADVHLSQPYPDRIDYVVGCEGELLDTFPTAAEALRAARSWAELTDCPYEIFDHAGNPLAIVEPPAAA